MISLLSIILDLLLNNYIKTESLFLSLFTVLSIIFIKRNKMYYLKIFIIGVIYDLIFTNYYILNGFIFLLLGFFINFYYKKIKYGIINNLLLGLIIFVIYQLILFIVLNVTNINILSFNEFIFITKHFIISSVLYIIILSIIIKKERLN